MTPKINGVTLTPLAQHSSVGGKVLHAVKSSDSGFIGFQEAYFSTCDPKAIKAWKKHKLMTLNLVAPVSEFLIVLYDLRKGSPSFGNFDKIYLSRSDFHRLTVPPEIWFGFCNLGTTEGFINFC